METPLTQSSQAVIAKRNNLGIIGKAIITLGSFLILSGLIAGFFNHKQTGSWAGAGSNLTIVFVPLIIFGIVLLFVGLLLRYSWNQENQAVAAMLAGKDVLAHWTYAPQMAEQFGAIEMARLKWQLYLVKLPLAFMGLACFGWWGTGFHTFRMFLLMVCGGAVLGLLLGLLAWFIAYRQATQTRNQQSMSDVYITRQGVLTGGTYHHWDTSNQRLSSVVYEASHPAILQFNYLIGTSPVLSSISTATLIADAVTEGEVGYRTNILAETVRVPVPPGKEQQAQEIAAMLSKPM